MGLTAAFHLLTDADASSSNGEGGGGGTQGVCASPGCGKQAAMACPKCLELKRAPTLFCSQVRSRSGRSGVNRFQLMKRGE